MSNLLIKQFTLGPLENNTYLIIDRHFKQVVAIDPAIGSSTINQYLKSENLNLSQVWITHAHFDHFAGINDLVAGIEPITPVFLHILDQAYFKSGGGIREYFGGEWNIPKGITIFSNKTAITFGSIKWTVIHTPGHRPGHVVFYSRDHSTAFCGDLIFKSSIGRTDLEGGNYQILIDSIKGVLFSLPDETVLLPGHGPATTIGCEKLNNPFLF